MSNWLTEFLYMLTLSKRALWSFILGILFYIGITLLGEHMVTNLELDGALNGMEKVISHKLIHKYDKAALVSLLSFWGLAIKPVS